MSDVKKYRLIGTKHFGRDDEGNEISYKTGDLVPLSEVQYEAFKDKFEVSRAEAREDAKEGLAPGESKVTPTQPQSAADGKPGATPAPVAGNTTPASGAAGAGAAANSSNTATK